MLCVSIKNPQRGGSNASVDMLQNSTQETRCIQKASLFSEREWFSPSSSHLCHLLRREFLCRGFAAPFLIRNLLRVHSILQIRTLPVELDVVVGKMIGRCIGDTFNIYTIVDHTCITDIHRKSEAIGFAHITDFSLKKKVPLVDLNNTKTCQPILYVKFKISCVA